MKFNLHSLKKLPRVSAVVTVLWLLQVFLASPANAQVSDRDFIRMGNRLFRIGNFPKAETYHLKAIDKKPTMEARYNLALALAMQSKDSTAFDSYQKSLDEPSVNTRKKAFIYHNMGNMAYGQGLREMSIGGKNATQSFQQAVDFYKNSLRMYPDDDETRYNLAMAQYMLKKSQQGGGGGDSDQQKQDQKDQDKDQQQDQQQDQQKKQQPPKPKDDKNQMDDKTIEQLLNSAHQDEKEVQQKVQKQPAQRRSLEKDW